MKVQAFPCNSLVKGNPVSVAYFSKLIRHAEAKEGALSLLRVKELYSETVPLRK